MRPFCVFLAAVFFIAPAAGRADDAAALLAKHRAYVGWQFGDGSLTSIVMSGTITVKRAGGTVRKVYAIRQLRSGVAYRTQETDPGKGTYHSGFTGHVYWASDQNGFTRPELGDVQKYNVAYDLLRNEATSEMPGELRAAATVDGMTTQVVRVTDANAYPIDLYIDPETGAYKRAVIDPGGIYETTIDILAYSQVLPGKKLMSKWSVGSGGGMTITQFSFFKPNVVLTPAELHPPKPVAYWTFGKGDPVPLRLTQERIYLHAKVNGVDGNFIFDSGDGGGILLTQQFADRAHVKVEGSGFGVGVGGTTRNSVIRIHSLQVGDSTLHDVVAQAQDVGYNRFSEAGGTIVADGLIGYDLLAGAIVTMNFDSGTLRVQDPATTSVDSTKGLLAVIDLSDAIPRLPMKVDGIDVNAMLDTGNAGYVLYSPDLRSKYGLRVIDNTGLQFQAGDIIATAGTSYIAGLGGESAANCGSFGDLTLGPIVYKSVAGCETQEWSGREILVGLDFMRHFNYIFDYPHAQMVIIPRNGE